MTTSAQDIYAEFKDVLSDTKGPDAQGRLWAFCPSHADGTKHGRRSLSLHPKYGLKCFAGCNFTDILAVLRSHTMPSRPQPATSSDLVAVYKYRDISGNVIAEHGRFEKNPGEKSFGWRLPGGTWREGLKGKTMAELPLYNADILAQRPNEPVYLVEGEKTADACMEQGLLAVTVPQGASGSLPSKEQLSILTGRTVNLWADNDPPGHELMTRVQAIVRSVAKTTAYVSTPIALPAKGDAFDYFAMGGTVEALSSAIQEVTVEHKSIDNLILHYPTPQGTLHFDFDAIEKHRHAFDTELTIHLNGNSADSFSQRINIMSSSARTDLRRDLDALYGKDYGWTGILNKAFSNIKNVVDSVFAKQTHLNDT